MPFITSAPSGQTTTQRVETQQSNRPSFKATQTIAKQKAFEKKAKNYKLPLGELAIFTQQLSSLLNAGLPLVQSLEALQEQTEDQVFCVVIREVKQEISSGNSFSTSVKKFPRSFPALFISMVEAGEASGALAEILGKVAGYFEASVKLTKKVKSAMTYPIAVIGLAIVLVNVLLIFVVPVFADMFKDMGAKLPVPTQMLIDLSHFLGSWRGAVLLVAVIAAAYALRKYTETPVGRRHTASSLPSALICGTMTGSSGPMLIPW